MRIRFKFLCIFFILLPAINYAQDVTKQIDNLRYYANLITLESADFQKYAANERFRLELKTIFDSKKSKSFPFDSVKNISVLTAPDKKFKIITWVLPKENATYEYYGFILFTKKTSSSKKYVPLTDNTDKINSPENAVIDCKNWYGAVYYKMILTRYQGKKHYTLLGWKGNNNMTTKKVIEVLQFRSSGVPSFGAPLFRKYKDKPTRIIFEYSSRSSMLLRYDKQMIHTIIKAAHTKPGKYNPKDINSGKALKSDKKYQAKDKITKSNMIVFDRLSPIDNRTSKYAANLEGQYQFYAPESNIMDAFIFANGKWIYTKDVDARNPKTKQTKANKSPKPSK